MILLYGVNGVISPGDTFVKCCLMIHFFTLLILVCIAGVISPDDTLLILVCIAGVISPSDTLLVLVCIAGMISPSDTLLILVGIAGGDLPRDTLLILVCITGVISPDDSLFWCLLLVWFPLKKLYWFSQLVDNFIFP